MMNADIEEYVTSWSNADNIRNFHPVRNADTIRLILSQEIGRPKTIPQFRDFAYDLLKEDIALNLKRIDDGVTAISDYSRELGLKAPLNERLWDELTTHYWKFRGAARTTRAERKMAETKAKKAAKLEAIKFESRRTYFI